DARRPPVPPCPRPLVGRCPGRPMLVEIAMHSYGRATACGGEFSPPPFAREKEPPSNTMHI
ncbi:hypothetical protein Dimus_004240, partial [Dionaea muscipula]